MIGDTQPKKRKEKKRKKEEGPEEVTPQRQSTSPAKVVDEGNLHVHSESTTGGGYCAKFVFFVLLATLAALIGLIITQHRGLTDLDNVESESRYAQIFDGWTEDSKVSHEYAPEDDEHSEENEEHENSEDEESQEDGENEAEDSKSVEESVEASDNLSEEEDETNEDENNENEDKTDENEDESNENDDEDESNENDDEINEEEENKPSVENISNEDDGADTENAEEIQSEQEEPVRDGEVDELSDEAEAVEESPVEESVDTTNLAVKFGVGMALLVVAHIVLISKWKTAKTNDNSSTSTEGNRTDLGRRNTIVPPPTLDQIERDIEKEEHVEEQSDSEEIELPKVSSAKAQYQELQSTYSRKLPSNEQVEVPKKTEPYEDYEDDEDLVEESDEEDDFGNSELLKRLEEKYGRLRNDDDEEEEEVDEEESDEEESEDDDYEHFASWKHVKPSPDPDVDGTKPKSGAQEIYEFDDITNSDDWEIRNRLDNAQAHLENDPAFALKLFNTLLEQHKNSPRALYGKARSFDTLAEKHKSNDYLEEAIKYYLKLLNLNDVPDDLFGTAAQRCINRMRFRGQYGNAVKIHTLMIEKYPKQPSYRNQLAVTYLTINKIVESRSVLRETLLKWPEDGFALVHYGFILKTIDNDLEAAVKLLKKGLKTKAEGVIDGRFYFHLGDALVRLGRPNEAEKVYLEGVKNGVFLSKYQRSLYNINRLTGKPWWNKKFAAPIKLHQSLEDNWRTIRDEGLAILNSKGYFKDESENLRDTGNWKQFELFARGIKHRENCKKCPFTCSLIERFPDVKSCKRGQVKYSVMHPGTHVWPHCGPTNCRLRVHLGLVVPKNTYIRVAEETRSWEEGKVFVFDDSFEHEVWHNGTELRLVLIVDIWHPELTEIEKRSLPAI